MDEFDRYTPHFIGIVLDIANQKQLESVSRQIIQMVQKIEGDDRIYIGGTGEMKRWRGQMIASVATYNRPLDFDIGKTIQDVMEKFSSEDSDARKLVFVFTDCYKSSFSYNVKISLAVNERRDLGNEVYVYGIGNNYDKGLESVCNATCKFLHLEDYSGLDRLIMSHYKEVA
jgi:hypothetical protein